MGKAPTPEALRGGNGLEGGLDSGQREEGAGAETPGCWVEKKDGGLDSWVLGWEVAGDRGSWV